METMWDRSKQVSDPSVLSEDNVDPFTPQLVELLEEHTSSVHGDHPQITLRDHDPVQASGNTGEPQNVRDVVPQDPRSYWSKTQHSKGGWVAGCGFHALNDLFHDVS